MILMEKKLLEHFTRKSCKKKKKKVKKSLKLKNLSREKVKNYMLNGKCTIILLIAG